MKKDKYEIYFSPPFERIYRRIIKRNRKLEEYVFNMMEKLSINPYYPSLKTHTVNVSGIGVVNSSWVTGDIRILWNFGEEDMTIIFLSIGGHSGSNKVYDSPSDKPL